MQRAASSLWKSAVAAVTQVLLANMQDLPLRCGRLTMDPSASDCNLNDPDY